MAKQTEANKPTEQPKPAEQPKPPEQPKAEAPPYADLKEDVKRWLQEFNPVRPLNPAESMLLPGDSVCVLDRWVDAGSLMVCAGIITGINACDEGHYNVRILADPTRNDQDRDCLSVRLLEPDSEPRRDERYLILTREEAAKRLFPKPPAKKAK